MSRWLLLLCALVFVAARPSDRQMSWMRRSALKTASQLKNGEFNLQSKTFELQAATCNLNAVFGDPSFGEFQTCLNPFDTYPFPNCSSVISFTDWCNDEVAANNDHTCAESYQRFFTVVENNNCVAALFSNCSTSADCVDPTQVCHLGFCEDTCVDSTECDECMGETCGPASTDSTRMTCISPANSTTDDNVASRNAALQGFKHQTFCTADATAGNCFDLQRTIDPSVLTCAVWEATGCCGPFFGRFYGDCFSPTDPANVAIQSFVQMCNTTSNAGILCFNEFLFPCSSQGGAAQIGASLLMIIASIVAAFNFMF